MMSEPRPPNILSAFSLPVITSSDADPKIPFSSDNSESTLGREILAPLSKDSVAGTTKLVFSPESWTFTPSNVLTSDNCDCAIVTVTLPLIVSIPLSVAPVRFVS